MRNTDKSDVVFWCFIAAACIAIAAYAAAGVAQGAASESKAASVPPVMATDESDDLAQQHRSHSVEAVEAGKLDAEGNPIDDMNAKLLVIERIRDYAQAKRDQAMAEAEPAEEPEEYYEPEYVESVDYGYSGYAGGVNRDHHPRPAQRPGTRL